MTVGAAGRVHIDLEALAANYRLLAAAARPGRCAAVVKAAAYRLGLPAVVELLLREGCREFFVAVVSEGVAVRELAPDAAIYVFDGPIGDDLDAYRQHALVPVVNHAAQLELLAGVPALPFAVHADTGMHRLGVASDVLTPEWLGGREPVLIMTHLACADEPEHPLNPRQAAAFAEVGARFPGVALSTGNSAGTLLGDPFRGDVCRAGIALYGGNPFIGRDNPMAPVVTLEGRVLALAEVPAGERIGYGATHATRTPCVIATVGIGYADGLPRQLGNSGEAAFRGRRLPIVGRVSMDLTTVDASAVAGDLALGDWLELYGPTIGIDEAAACAGTIAYELLTRLGDRLERRYV